MAENSLLPAYTTPDEVAHHLKVSERTVRSLARKIGAYHLLGKRMILTDDDMSILMEAIRCPSQSTNATAGKSGISGAPLRAGGYGVLVRQLTEKQRKGSLRKSNSARGKVISMARKQP